MLAEAWRDQARDRRSKWEASASERVKPMRPHNSQSFARQCGHHSVVEDLSGVYQLGSEPSINGTIRPIISTCCKNIWLTLKNATAFKHTTPHTGRPCIRLSWRTHKSF